MKLSDKKHNELDAEFSTMLSTGCIKEIVNGSNVTNPRLQILAFKVLGEDKGFNNTYRLLLTDGKYYFEGFILLGSQSEHIKNGTLKRNTIIELNEFYTIKTQTRLKTIIAIRKMTKIEDASKGCFSQKLIPYISNSEESSQKIVLKYVSLKDICSEIKRGREYFGCTIKIKVESKSPVKPWKKNEREGMYTTMMFQDNDDEEQKIKAINFNEKLNDIIETDMVYYVTHFKVGRKKSIYDDDDRCQIVLYDKTNIISVLKATMYSEEISDANQENKRSNNFSEENHFPLSRKHCAASNKSDIQEIQQENFIKNSNTVVKDQNWINLIIVVVGFLMIIIVLNFWVQTRLHLYLPEK